jgi:hypothetical protein
MAVRTPNDRLRALLCEAAWSGGRLARAVNDVGTENKVPLHYGRVSVAQWLSGVRPRHPAPELVAEALSRRLNRSITPAMAGFGTSDPLGCRTGEREDDVVAQLTEADRPEHGRRDVLRDCVYSVAALSVPGWAEAIAGPAIRHPATEPVRAGRAEVEAAITMARLFSDADAASGGGQVRPALSAYLATTVAPWLKASTGARVRPALFSVAARLTYLYAFTCFDDELHGTAQRYYRIGLRLAAEAGDPTMYAITLRAMSVQAHQLGHHRHALNLAEAAAATGGRAAPLTAAFLSGQLAVAFAGTGDRRAALASLRTAERHLEAADSPAAIGAYHHGSLAHQRAAALAGMGDRAGALAALRDSIRHRPPSERRSRTITLARLAELQLRHGHLEQAADTWHHFLDDYPAIDCGRARTALTNLRTCLRPHAGHIAAEALLHRASAL